MPTRTEYRPGSVAPDSGIYRLVNVFGDPTDYCVYVRRDGRLPVAPRGFSWWWEREAVKDEGDHS